MTTMTIQTVKVGRREFDYITFANTVKSSKAFSELCDKLGMNKTVQTTINVLKERVKELNLDTSHFTTKYNVSEKVYQSARNNSKQFNIVGVNKVYYDEFCKSFADRPTSWSQYKVHLGDFLEKLGNNDFATVTAEEIELYSNYGTSSKATKANCKAHIRSMLAYIVKENIEGAFGKVSKEVLVWML